MSDDDDELPPWLGERMRDSLRHISTQTEMPYPQEQPLDLLGGNRDGQPKPTKRSP